MIFEGKAIQLSELEDGIVKLTFDYQGESVNKFDRVTLNEFREANAKLASYEGLKGVVVTSAKDVFIVGADITEFVPMFRNSEEDIVAGITESNRIFNAFEDLPVPTVAAINGIALGGGFEMCLACDFRVMSTKAKVGLPEVKLGIFPGFGGTVRLPRVIGADNAIEWICSGSDKRPDAALKDGAVDAVVAPEKLEAAAVDLIRKANLGDLDAAARKTEKKTKLKLNPIESMMVFEVAKGFVAGKAGPNYPAPVTAIKVIQKAAGMNRDKALAVEAQNFAKMAKTSAAQNLIGLFLNDQTVKSVAKKHAKKSSAAVEKAAVLGAGIMGGGIAYQSASKGTPIVMKDIRDEALDLGMSEATKLLNKKVSRNRMSTTEMAETLGRIKPTLNLDDLKGVDVVVEAVVENTKIKQSVLAEVEKTLGDDAILTSNTSTISISLLAEALDHPERFCGMHFFNPVHMMPLVEVIRGEKTSDEAIARTVAFAQKLGKTPIVVNDCPGFLVNRVLFPYFAGFTKLVGHGADFRHIDKVMSRFGWPMGPAYLLDVVGIDTGHHANAVMAEGFPDRMKSDEKTALDIMYENDRYGQKNNKGFYIYELDKKGKPKKVDDPEVDALLKPVVTEQREFTDQQIIERMMIPLCIEMVRCMEENIVASPAEGDMALIYGIGFPPFRGGALRYIDEIGLQAFCDMADKYAELGKLYEPTEGMRTMAANGETFYK
jgi:3-hydroxyacyl-CoA dehydrogenase/enoyl-CoA hydratase/3-hydroxybutyryl-CoA epimerase/enoyl-CoA isomerase